MSASLENNWTLGDLLKTKLESFQFNRVLGLSSFALLSFALEIIYRAI